MERCSGHVPPIDGLKEDLANARGTTSSALHCLQRCHLGTLLDELEKVTTAREVWVSLPRLLPL